MAIEDNPILIIDDEEIVLLAISESLAPEGYRIVKTTNPHEGLELLKKEAFSVIISDHHMPGMTGLEFFAEANKIQPMASRILITGVLTLKVVVDAINKGEIFRFIAKPWIREELLATVKNAIHRFELLAQNSQLQLQTEASKIELAQRNIQLESEISELKSQLRFHANANSSSDANVINALELNLRLLSNIDSDLEREARLVVETCKAMIGTGRIATHTAAILKIASYIATLGKISIDREKLKEFYQNASSFSADELEYFHNIPVYSQLYASQFESMPELSQTLRSYYERPDGRGYPDGLSGNQIPDAANYLSIAVYYAESPFSTQATVDRIRQGSGKLFSTDAVSTFLEARRTMQNHGKLSRLAFHDLKPGMVTGEDIRNESGAIILSRGASLSSTAIETLKKHQARSSQAASLLVNI
jgi:response regulator RpfG family c-di-GMP phosphodiesterase